MSSETEIRPFRADMPDDAITDLQWHIAATRWPNEELVAGRSQGVQLATLRELARYWATDYDWRAYEAGLNALPQFKTEIDGMDIHFIHVRSRHADALPLIITHGWPGSITEMLGVIGPLTDPAAHGGSAAVRLRSSAAVPAWLRLLRRAGRARLERRPHRRRLGGADASPRLHPLRRPRGRRGRRCHRRAGPPGTRGAGRHPHEPAAGRAGRRLPVAGPLRGGTRGARRHPPRSWVEKTYPNVTYFNEADRGGHFAAWEEPELFATEIRAAFRLLR
jgi:hypothetical protein